METLNSESEIYSMLSLLQEVKPNTDSELFELKNRKNALIYKIDTVFDYIKRPDLLEKIPSLEEYNKYLENISLINIYSALKQFYLQRVKEKEVYSQSEFWQTDNKEGYLEKFLQEYNAIINNSIIEIPLEDITLSTDNNKYSITLQRLKIQLKIHNNNINIYILESEVGDPNFCHPHVKNGELCLGEAQAAIETAILRVDLFSLVEIIKSTLNTYNPTSCYISIERLLGLDECYNCESTSDSCETCIFCGEIFCESCIDLEEFVEESDEYVCCICKRDLSKCPVCDIYFRHETVTTRECAFCNQEICPNCLEQMEDEIINYFNLDSSYCCLDCRDRYRDLQEEYKEKEEDDE